MISFDASKLRVQVVRDFQALAGAITDAEEMNRFMDIVMTTAVGTLRERVNRFNQQSTVGRLPANVLAACFVYLPFRFCISPSHVCRSWRAAALAEPALWSKISTWSCRNRPELLQMALSRASALPVDLLVDSTAPAEPDVVCAAIAPFSRQIRYLAWYSESPSSSWDIPAPNMEGFCCACTMTITPDFFGGRYGRLRCLYLQCVYLPSVCSVLSTVTELSVRLTPDEVDSPPSMLENLFALFPRLQWLQILVITRHASHMLPTGPAPTSLKEVVLRCISLDYDLIPHYLAWDTGNIRHVSLSQCPDTILPDLAPLAHGTVRLAIKHHSEPGPLATHLMFEHSETVSHSIYLSGLGGTETAALLESAKSSLDNVHTALVSYDALQPLVGVLTALPAVEHLFIHIMPKTQRMDVRPAFSRWPFPWDLLSPLSELACTMPRLRSITLQVWCRYAYFPPLTNAENARALISRLRALGTGLPPIEIQGFPAEEISSIDLTGLDVRFDVLAPVGELVLHEERTLYYPFSYA